MMPASLATRTWPFGIQKTSTGDGWPAGLGGDQLLHRLLAVDLVVVDLDAVLRFEAADDLGEEVLLGFAEVVEDDLPLGFRGRLEDVVEIRRGQRLEVDAGLDVETRARRPARRRRLE